MKDEETSTLIKRLIAAGGGLYFPQCDPLHLEKHMTLCPNKCVKHILVDKDFENDQTVKNILISNKHAKLIHAQFIFDYLYRQTTNICAVYHSIKLTREKYVISEQTSVSHELSKIEIPKIFPVCTVCYESYKPHMKIFQCVNGHTLCKSCKTTFYDKLDSSKLCIQCRAQFIMEPAIDFMKLVNNLHEYFSLNKE